MLPLILSIIISQYASDTIFVKGIQGIAYQAFVFQDTLYFQYKTSYKWSDPIVLDNGNVSSPSMAMSSDGYLHIVWCKKGGIYYRTTFEPITKNTLKNKIIPQWSPKVKISTQMPQTEPASNLFIKNLGDTVFIQWHRPGDLGDNKEIWRRKRWIQHPSYYWPFIHTNCSQNVVQEFDYPLYSVVFQQLCLKEVAHIPAGTVGSGAGHILCGDTDNNGENELIFQHAPSGALRYVIYEYHATNRYELVWFAVGGQPPPPGGILVGNFAPNDIGDIDKDSLADLVGRNTEYYYNDYFHSLVSTQESLDSSSFPESLSWYQRYSSNGAEAAPFYYAGDLDQDGKEEIQFTSEQTGYNYIFENVTNDSNELVWSRFQAGIIFTYGDFDLDGRKEFVSANPASLGRTYVYENVAPDSYELVFVDTVRRPNGYDIFSGKDLDGDGKPEFLVCFAQNVGGSTFDYYLYMWETTGNNTYERNLIDIFRAPWNWSARSKCGDIDGDGIEEIVWSIGSKVFIYKATGNNQFQLLWEWTHPYVSCSQVNIYDMNQNGYNEIVITGWDDTWLYEIEAVRLLSPNGGQNFLPGDSVLIQWQKFYPPRCDSLSLFYSLNNGRTYDTIITGLPGTDSSYLWTVPDTASDSCKVKIIAYGPGWQYDESDGIFTITPSGIDEIASPSLAMTSIKILPNPTKGKIRFRIWNANQDLTLKIYNLTGELVKDFSERFFASSARLRSLDASRSRMTKGVSEFIWDGTDDKGKRLPTGVYFYRLKTSGDISETKEFIILR